MRKNRSEFASKTYPNLYWYEGKYRSWCFRKYSAEKKAEFFCVTGEAKNESKAYKEGVRRFDEWLSKDTEPGGDITFGQYARVLLNRKLARSEEELAAGSKRTSKYAIEKLIKAFGYLRLDQVNEDRWELYCSNELRQKPQKMFNRLKELKEVLRRAHRNGLIPRLPDLKNPDTASAPPKRLSRKTIRALLRAAHPRTRLLIYIMWRQGARPGEIIQYRWDMVHWDEGDNGYIHIPAKITKTRRARAIPLNSRVARVLRWMLKNADRFDPKKAKGERRRTMTWIQNSVASPYLFPATTGRGHILEYKRGWESAKTEADVDAIPYNLRDTFITDCAIRGMSILFTAKYCDTSVKMIERHYAMAEQSAMQKVAG